MLQEKYMTLSDLKVKQLIFIVRNLTSLAGSLSVILLFVQQTEPPHLFSLSRNSNINRRKKKKIKLPTTAIKK